MIGALISAVFMSISGQHVHGERRRTLSVYLGWLSVATMVETLILLKVNGLINLFGLPKVFWILFALVLAGFLAIVFMVTQHDFGYPLVFIGAYLGIAIKNLSETSVFVTCCCAIVLMAWMRDRVKRNLTHSISD